MNDRMMEEITADDAGSGTEARNRTAHRIQSDRTGALRAGVVHPVYGKPGRPRREGTASITVTA